MPKYGRKAYEQLERMMTEYELTDRKPDESVATAIHRRKSVKKSTPQLKKRATKSHARKNKS